MSQEGWPISKGVPGTLASPRASYGLRSHRISCTDNPARPCPISPWTIRSSQRNIELTRAENGELVVESNFLLAELSIQAKHEMHWWVGRTTHHLRSVDGTLKMSRKKVVLVNAAEPLPNLSFLI